MNTRELIEYVHSIADVIPVVESFNDVDPYTYWNSEEVKYGSLIFAVKGYTRINRTLRYNVILYYGDRVLADESNVNNIYTDAQTTINFIIKNIELADGSITILDGSPSVTFFRQRFLDDLAGGYCNFTIETDDSVGACGYNGGQIISPSACDEIIDALQGRIEVLMNDIDDLQDQIESLEGTIAEKDSTIESLQRRINSLTAEINDLETQIRNLNLTIQRKNQTISDLEGQVDTLTQTITDLNATISNLESQISDLNTEIDNFESRIRTLNLIIMGKDQIISNLEGQIRDLNQTITTLNATISNLESQIADLSTKTVEYMFGHCGSNDKVFYYDDQDGGDYTNIISELPTGWTASTIPSRCSVEIIPTPADATVIINGQSNNPIYVPVGSTVTWSVSRPGYVSQSGSFVATTNSTDFVDLTAKDYSSNPLTIISLEDNNVIGFKFEDTSANARNKEFEISTDGGTTWVATDTTHSDAVTLNRGEEVWVRGRPYNYPPTTFEGATVITSKTVDIAGKLMSILHPSDWNDGQIRGSSALAYFFINAKVVNADKLILGYQSYVTGTIYGFFRMFQNVTTLVSAQFEIPSADPHEALYDEMFYGCTALKYAPIFKVKDCTGKDAFMKMFEGCTSLEVAPELPATRVGQGAYVAMFRGCTSLKQAPSSLPVAKIPQRAFASMFEGCTSLEYPPTMAAVTVNTRCCEYMFRNCTSLKASPMLYATSLATNCYREMFYGCSSLTSIKAMFTTTPSSSYTDNWVNGVAANGVFHKNSSAGWNVTGVNGVPLGWLVYREDYS